LTDSNFWFLAFTPTTVTTVAGLPGQLVGYATDSAPGSMNVDRYRHGKYPSTSSGSPLRYSISGGQIKYNILFLDGHVMTSTDIVDAYKAIRMRGLGN
jgi:prepilin-type processing-associated H-X9-DG protein